MALKLLAAADLHLGRRPSRLPASLTDRITARELGPAGAWERLVDLALEEEVHAVLLAGDVVEGEHDFFEAYGELRKGVVRLVESGVRVLAVAGNHDTNVLPYLSDELTGFQLLGRGGRWEAATLSAGGEEATIWGWSFPRPSVREDPVTGHSFRRGPGPNLGLLHCDRDQAGSPYGPVASRALEAAELDGWLLGHIHGPDPLSTPRPTGYLGSLTGLDPGEAGPRGPWMLKVDGAALTGLEHRPIAPLRWIVLDVGLDGLGEPEEARSRFLERLRALHEGLREEARPPLAVGIRLTFVGRTRFRQEVEKLFQREELGDVSVGDGSVHYFVEALRVDTLPEVELEELARQGDPVGLLARRLLLLEASPKDPERQALISRARLRLERVARDPHRQGLERDGPDGDETVEWLRRAGKQALDLLLAQRDGP